MSAAIEKMLYPNYYAELESAADGYCNCKPESQDRSH